MIHQHIAKFGHWKLIQCVKGLLERLVVWSKDCDILGLHRVVGQAGLVQGTQKGGHGWESGLRCCCQTKGWDEQSVNRLNDAFKEVDISVSMVYHGPRVEARNYGDFVFVLSHQGYALAACNIGPGLVGEHCREKEWLHDLSWSIMTVFWSMWY